MSDFIEDIAQKRIADYRQHITPYDTKEERKEKADQYLWRYLEKCDHKNKRLVYFDMSNGTRAYQDECPDCFWRSQMLSKSTIDIIKAIPRIEPEKSSKLRNILWAEQKQSITEIEVQQNAAWWEEYNTYLQTPAWFLIRGKVMRRANHICEGCKERPATEIHHLTYDRVFHEMLFDLAAICHACHQKIHAKGGG